MFAVPVTVSFPFLFAGSVLSLVWPVPQDPAPKAGWGRGGLLRNTAHLFLRPLLSAPRKRAWCFFYQPTGREMRTVKQLKLTQNKKLRQNSWRLG